MADNTTSVVSVQDAMRLAGMGTDRPFSPGEPLPPFRGVGAAPRAFDFPTGVNIAARPRHNERVAFETLKGLIRSYDVAQMCIWHRIDSIRALSWDLVAMPGFEGVDISGYRRVGLAALKKPDRRRRFTPWLTRFLFDVLAYDAGALYRIRNRAGRAIGLQVVDGTSIAPLLDEFGEIPMPAMAGELPPPAYVQFAQGVPWTDLSIDDLIYEPFRQTSESPYGVAPLESILLNANTDLRFQWHFLQRFTEGNVPEAFATAPEGWSPQQIEDFQDAWDAFMLGDQSRKSQIRWVPNGTGFAWSNEATFDSGFSLFLMRKTASAYHVTPQDLGFTEDVNRATSETQVDNQFRVGDLPLAEHVQSILSTFLQDDLGLPLDFQFDLGQEKEDRLSTAQADEIYVNIGAISPSEVRERVYGLSEPDGQPVPRYIFTARSGPIPLSALKAVAGPVDPASGAPSLDAALPHKPFAPVEGVTPMKPPNRPALAVVEYPSDNVDEDPATGAPLAAAPVGKGEGAGVTVDGGTVAASYDLIGDDEADDDIDRSTQRAFAERVMDRLREYDDAQEPVAKAADVERAAFARFRRARLRAGRWRDFTFAHIAAGEAQRLNAAGRAAVRKAAGELVAAGMAVQAVDTGRVLLLQRGLGDPGDEAAGAWEFPGGHLEPGESAFDAAAREWMEETGCLLPDGDVSGGWLSDDGIYEGIIYTIAAEAQVPILDRGQVVNPDDPDGDVVEALAWWAPEQLGGPLPTGGCWVNPALRRELQASIPAVQDSVAHAIDAFVAAVAEPAAGSRYLTIDEARAAARTVCPCGTPIEYDAIDGWQHADGSISHDDGQSVSDKMAALVAKAGGADPKAGAGARARAKYLSTRSI